jgi:site-specific recombinase XerD
LLEDGINFLSLMELLGHARIETTLIYLHVANIGSSKKFSPLDTLYAKD